MNSNLNYKNISLFKGLNALRFIAAFLVVIHHVESIRIKNGMENLAWLGLFRNGGNGVTFFFVLSGFLITYLLLKECHKTETINIKKFYFKRILRIWPLYFLLIAIGTILLPLAFSLLNIDYVFPYTLNETWFYWLFFLPGLVTFFYGHHFLEPLWSIGVEEVFYLIWAPLFKIGKRYILSILISVILIKSIANVLALTIIHNELINYLIGMFTIEAMSVGGLGAYFVYTRGNLINRMVIFRIPAQIIIFSIILLYLFFHINIDQFLFNTIFKTPIASPMLINFLFLYVIICVSLVDNSIIKLRNKQLSFLGEISYGIYMYHMLVIFATILFLKNSLAQINHPWDHIVFYLIIVSFTILISSLSKYLFENPFLRLKNKLIFKK